MKPFFVTFLFSTALLWSLHTAFAWEEHHHHGPAPAPAGPMEDHHHDGPPDLGGIQGDRVNQNIEIFQQQGQGLTRFPQGPGSFGFQSPDDAAPMIKVRIRDDNGMWTEMMVKPSMLSNLLQQQWENDFINRGQTEFDRHNRMDMVKNQHNLVDNMYSTDGLANILNGLTRAAETGDFVFDWGTTITQDVTKVPVNTVYGHSKNVTILIQHDIAVRFFDSKTYEKEAKDTIKNFALNKLAGEVVDELLPDVPGENTIKKLTGVGFQKITDNMLQGGGRSLTYSGPDLRPEKDKYGGTLQK